MVCRSLPTGNRSGLPMTIERFPEGIILPFAVNFAAGGPCIDRTAQLAAILPGGQVPAWQIGTGQASAATVTPAGTMGEAVHLCGPGLTDPLQISP